MKGFCRIKPLLMDGSNKANGISRKEVGKVKRLNVASLNSHLICVLCSGYYVEATAIVECLHTFCRSCIVKYLQSNSFCPICDVQIHQSKPWSSLRPDKILQDLVYKLVPGLYQNEMRRRRQFYSRLGKGGSDDDDEKGEENGFPPQGARFFSQDDSISLSLEYYTGGYDGDVDEDVTTESKGSKDEGKCGSDKAKRYLQCPAAVTVRHLKKFLRMKYGIGLDSWVDIIYNDECLPEEFTLIDVAYTFTWKRTSPMRFAYRIYSKAALRVVKSQKNYQKSRVDEEEKKRSRYQSSLEQQMQNEYLGNFNLNPTNSSYCKSQNYNRTKTAALSTANSKHGSISNSNNNNSNSVKNNNNNSSHSNGSRCERKSKRDEYVFRDFNDSDDKLFQSSEDSNASVLQIISEKEDSLRGDTDDDDDDDFSLDSDDAVIIGEINRRKSVVDYGEDDSLDGFGSAKVLRSAMKNRSDGQGRRDRKRMGGGHVMGEKRRKTDLDGVSQVKKRKSLAEEFGLKRVSDGEKLVSPFSASSRKDTDSLSSLKNEALRKVFVAKDKPEPGPGKRGKDGEIRRKKRKKSKHHEGDGKKRKSEFATAAAADTSPSIMSIAKDPLKLKVKLTSIRPVAKDVEETSSTPTPTTTTTTTSVKEDRKRDQAEVRDDGNRTDEADSKKSVSDKERLLHLRAVRHKTITPKTASPKDYINAPPSLTISKVQSSEQQTVKSALVESRPSLEIMLVSSSDGSGSKKASEGTNGTSKGSETAGKDTRPRSEVVDNFGVLDLSEKSTRTKENGTTTTTSPSSSSPTKETTDTVKHGHVRDKSTHQSILHIAQTLVNRKLSPMTAENSKVGSGNSDPVTTAAAMRNLKTLSDTAVNILMAAQSKNFPGCVSDPQKRPLTSAAITSSIQKMLSCGGGGNNNSTKSQKDCENGPGLKIPMYPVSRDRSNPIPPVPNLHEIYPRNRGRGLPLSKSPTTAATTPIIKPGQNQTVRQIPNPFVVLNRQTNQSQKALPLPPPPTPSVPQQQQTAVPPLPPPLKPSPHVDSSTDSPLLSKPKPTPMVPPLQSIKTKLTIAKLDECLVGDGHNGTDRNGSSDLSSLLPKIINNNTKTVQNNTEGSLFGLKNGGTGGIDIDRKLNSVKLNNNNNNSSSNNNNHNSTNSNTMRKIESMAKNIESVAAGLTARAVSNAMIDAK